MTFFNSKSRVSSAGTEPLAGDLPPQIGRFAQHFAKVRQLPEFLAKALRFLGQGWSCVVRWLEMMTNDCGMVIVVWSGSRRKPMVIDLRGKRRRSRRTAPATAVQQQDSQAYNSTPNFGPGRLW